MPETIRSPRRRRLNHLGACWGVKNGVQDSKKLHDLSHGFAGRWGGVVKSKLPGSLRLRIRIQQRQEVSKLSKNSFQIRDLTLRGFLMLRSLGSVSWIGRPGTPLHPAYATSMPLSRFESWTPF